MSGIVHYVCMSSGLRELNEIPARFLETSQVTIPRLRAIIGFSSLLLAILQLA